MVNSKRALFILTAIIIAGFLLRLYKWLGYSFWYDEVLWLLLSDGSFSLREFCILSFKPPLFAVVVSLWKSIFSSEFSLRFLSVVFGLVSILLGYRIAKTLFDRKTALITAFIIAFSPLHTHYSQELSHYSMTFCLSLLSMYFFISGLRRDGWSNWINYSVATVVCVYTNYTCVFLVAVQVLFFILRQPGKPLSAKKFLFSQGVIMIFMLLLINLVAGSIYVMNTHKDLIFHWIPQGGFGHLVQTLNVFVLGYNSTWLTRSIGGIFFFVLFCFGIRINRKERRRWLLPLLWLLLPLIFSVVIGKLFNIRTYTHRNFIFASLAYYLLVANVLSRLSGKKLFISFALVLFLFASSLVNYYNNQFFTPENIFRPGVHAKKDNRASVERIMTGFRPGDTVLHVCRCTNLPFFYYISLSQKPLIKELAANYYTGKGHFVFSSYKDNIVSYVEGYDRVWLVLSHWEPHTLCSPYSRESKVKKVFDETFELLEFEKFAGIEVYLYGI